VIESNGLNEHWGMNCIQGECSIEARAKFVVVDRRRTDAVAIVFVLILALANSSFI
jgi:hypothetical protein